MVLVVVVVTFEPPIGTHWLSSGRRMYMLGTVLGDSVSPEPQSHRLEVSRPIMGWTVPSILQASHPQYCSCSQEYPGTRVMQAEPERHVVSIEPYSLVALCLGFVVTI